jgi:hypothetical protein
MRRSSMQNTWVLCKRCSRKTSIVETTLQRGIRVCRRSSCYDIKLEGQREVEISQLLQGVASSKEGQPHELLTGEPVANEDIYF